MADRPSHSPLPPMRYGGGGGGGGGGQPHHQQQQQQQYYGGRGSGDPNHGAYPMHHQHHHYGGPPHGSQQPAMIGGSYSHPQYVTVVPYPDPQHPQRQIVPWSTTFFGCCEDKAVFKEAFCCFYCAVSYQSKALLGHPDTCNTGDVFCTMLSDVLCLLPSANATDGIRQQVGKRFGLEMSPHGDCLLTYFCRCCSIAQTHRELVYRGVFPGGCCVERPAAVLDSQPNYGGPAAAYSTTASRRDGTSRSNRGSYRASHRVQDGGDVREMSPSKYGSGKRSAMPPNNDPYRYS